MTNPKNTLITEEDVKAIMGKRRLTKRTKREIILVYTTFAGGSVLTLICAALHNILMFLGLSLVFIPVIYVTFFDKKQKAAEKFFLDNWRNTGQLLPKDWRYTGK